MRAARALGLHCVSRPQLLAEVVNAGGPGIAVSGTSGKSTILGMVAWLLREGGVPATVLGGAALVGEGTGGCFIAGPAEGPVVAEACESDGDRKSTRLNSSHTVISYAVFCLKKKTKTPQISGKARNRKLLARHVPEPGGDERGRAGHIVREHCDVARALSLRRRPDARLGSST